MKDYEQEADEDDNCVEITALSSMGDADDDTALGAQTSHTEEGDDYHPFHMEVTEENINDDTGVRTYS